MNYIKKFESIGQLQKVKVVQDESCHWYVIPENIYSEFCKDVQDESMIDSGLFDDKYDQYRTGGDLNNIQLYAYL